ncbi:MAG: hypothetical protein IRY99_12520 [Isosphaeraceae bacterium]|nr:hypothetical protein [Isosphaeraceae bacterium]
MRMRSKSLTAGLTLLGIVVLPAIGARQERKEEQRPLDPSVVAIRLMLGVGDRQTRPWNGRVQLDRGEVLGVEGWRFRQGDQVTGRDSWEARSHLVRKTAGKKGAVPTPKAKVTGPSTVGPQVTPNGVIVSLKAPEDATLTVTTDHGNFEVKLADLADGSPHRYLDGQVAAQRIPTGVPLIESNDQEDFPAAASDGRGGAWVVYVRHQPRGPEVSESFREPPKSFANFVPEGGGDQIRLLHFADGKPGEPIEVTGEGLDVWRPAVAVDGEGKVIVAWAENRDGNWDLYQRRYDPARPSWSEPKRLTTNKSTDTDVVLATAPDGTVWMAWQSWIDGQADIWLAPVENPERAVRISETPANEWSPALAIDQGGRIHVAYDSYLAGNYDIVLRTRGADGRLGAPIAITNSPRYEARPSLATDARGRVWIAYEERTENWGKDAENLISGQGTTLYRAAAVRVRCLDGGRLLDAPDPVGQASEALRSLNSYPRLAVDRSGRVWLTFRHREEAIWGNNAVMVVGGVWLEYATSLAGEQWTIPLPLPRSDGLLDNRPALVVPGDGPVLVFYSTDGRLRHEVEFTPELTRRFWAHSGTPGNPQSSFNEDLQVAALTPIPASKGQAEPTLRPASPVNEVAPVVHPNEAVDVQRMRAYRIQAGGKTYRLLRGEFHRHSELSQDGGSDGSLEDMWRYALDAGRLDWIGNGDHDNGGGKEYTWWLVQKTTDLYHIPPAFVPMFCYERSVAYPGGHRNVMFARRGVRTLPRLVDEKGVRDDVNGVDEDAAMLYAYLRELGGICAAHTTATGMGTDWRANDPKVEPVVEIFQGHRNSYEHLGAPRAARSPQEAIGGWRPLGMVWNALALQYRLGFQSSSDHISTHISFAVALAEDTTREAILDAFRRRHCYGATDNIVLDVRSGEHLMGDEFEANGPVSLRIFAHGTRPIARVDIIKDFVYVYSGEPKTERVAFQWTDEEKRPAGLSWYYVRVLQDDGEIAWGSPFWVRRTEASTAGR